jgi:hypothetical protein
MSMALPLILLLAPVQAADPAVPAKPAIPAQPAVPAQPAIPAQVGRLEGVNLEEAIVVVRKIAKSKGKSINVVILPAATKAVQELNADLRGLSAEEALKTIAKATGLDLSQEKSSGIWTLSPMDAAKLQSRTYLVASGFSGMVDPQAKASPTADKVLAFCRQLGANLEKGSASFLPQQSCLMVSGNTVDHEKLEAGLKQLGLLREVKN